MAKFKVGIIGYGWVAGAHIAAINGTGHAQVTSVCSGRALDAAALSARHGGEIKVFNKVEEFLAQPELQVVTICSLPHLHAKHAVAAANAGKHLYLEKPVGLNREECQAVRDAVHLAGVKTCAGFECRYSSQLRTTKAVVERGLLGRLHYAEVDYYHGIGPWYGQFRWNIRKEDGGSSLLTAGCHAMDALLFFMGAEIQSVSCYTTHSAHREFARYEYPTTSVTIVKFRDGRVGKVTSCIDALQPYYFRVHLIGSEGSMLDNQFYSTQLGSLDKAKWSELSMKLLDSGDASDHPYQAQYEAFFHALSLGEEVPHTNLREALLTHEVIFAADRSAQRHEQHA